MKNNSPKEEETLEELIIKEALYRTSQNNFNQASAGYNAKWFKRGGLFAAKLQKERDAKEMELLREEINYLKRNNI